MTSREHVRLSAEKVMHILLYHNNVRFNHTFKYIDETEVVGLNLRSR